MNLNEVVLNTNRTQNRMRLNKTAFHRGNQFVKPAPPNLRKKPVKSSTTSSSTHTNWGAPKNCGYTSTTLNTGSTSRTTTSSGDENQIILALTEGRGNAACEVGMAVIDLSRPSMILCQLSDTQSYINTLTKINILNPTEIIVPLTFIEGRFQNRLLEKIQQQFSHLKITGFARSAFRKENGIDQIRNLCLPQCNSVLLNLQHKYYCLSAASALLLFIENVRNVYYANESVKVIYEESEGSMIIDISAADKLELVANERIVEPGQKSTLLAVLNRCLTRVGNRTLRAMILQPPCSVPDIEARLDCITELINKPEMLAATQGILMKLNNADQILSLATLLPDSLGTYTERQLNYVLLLNLILDQIAPLREIFQETEQQFFLELRETLSCTRFADLKELLVRTIKSDAYPTKGSNATMQRCFAIKPGVNNMLDAVRKTYSELLNEMREYVETLGRKYGMLLTLANNNKKGFHMVLALTPQQKRTLKKSDLPPEFMQVCRLSGSFTMKTEELMTYSVRIEDITMNILQISNRIIRDLLMEIKNYLDIFYKLIEDIAKLDVLQSLAEASSGNGYVRPNFADYTDISNAKHPMLDILCSKEPITNPIQASSEYNMHIITGPNGSGKSIYIRQVALIQIMAQVGSYVPATNATLRVCDRLFTRISLDDNMECNISTFELELLEIKNFLTTMTKNSLVIIDELCRSTAVEEGTALAMAICETMLMTPAFIFVTTHYTIITKLQELYCNVKVWQMEADVTGTDITNAKLNLKYNLIPGCTSLKRYGIYLIGKMWPQNIVKFIENVIDDLTQTQAPQAFETAGVSEKTKLIYEVKAEIESLKRKKQLTKAAINTILNKYQRQLQEFGVKMVHEDETSESEKQTASASQVTYDYVPEGMDEGDDGVYERLYESVGNVNYLMPDVSLREYSQNYICSPSESNVNISYRSGELVARGGEKSSQRIELTPVQSVTASQTVSQYSPVSPMENTEVSDQFFDAAPSPSFGDPRCSKYLTPEGNFSFSNKGSPSFFIQNPTQERQTSAADEFFVPSQASQVGIRQPSPFVFHDSNASGQFFMDARSCSRSKEQSHIFVPDEEIYPSPEVLDEIPPNCSSEYFENVPLSSKRPQSRNASFTSLNQAKFNVDMFGNTARTSTPLNRTKEGADEASVLSSVNRTKFMAGLRKSSTPVRKVVNATFGCVFEANQKRSTPETSKSVNSPFMGGDFANGSSGAREKYGYEPPKKLQRSAVSSSTRETIDEASDASKTQASFQGPTKDNTQELSAEKSNSLVLSKKQPTPVSSGRKVHASSIGDQSKSVYEASFSSASPLENRMGPSTSSSKALESAENFDKKSMLANQVVVPYTNQSNNSGKTKQKEVNASTSLFGNSKTFVSGESKRVHEVSMKQANSVQRDKWKSSADSAQRSNQNVSVCSSNQMELTSKSVERVVNASTSFCGNKSRSLGEASVSAENQKKFTQSPLQREPRPSTSVCDNFEPVVVDPPGSGILELMMMDFEKTSMLANKSLPEQFAFSINKQKVTTPVEDRVDASASLFGSSKSAERAESLHEASSSRITNAKVATTPPQRETSASTSFSSIAKSFVPEDVQEALNSSTVPRITPLRTSSTLPQRETNASASFFGIAKSFVPEDVQEALNSSTVQRTAPLRTSPPSSGFGYLEAKVVDFGKKLTSVNRSFLEGPVSSVNEAKVTTPLERGASTSFFGNLKPGCSREAGNYCAEQAKPMASSLQKKTDGVSSKQFDIGFSKQPKGTTEAKPTPISLDQSIAHASTSYLEEERPFGAVFTPERDASRTSSSIYCTPNAESTSSLNSSKFLAGLTKTSTPLLQRSNSFNFESSISYSPLCPSPIKTDRTLTASTQKPKKRLGVRCNRFIPPNKLTKRQIEAEFAEQTLKMMQASDSSKVSDYARQICNRPSVKQLQESEHIASIKRTGDGVVVIPAKKERKTRERAHNFNFKAPYKKVFEPNLLSDANEGKFMEFLEHGKKSTNVETEQKQTEMEVSGSNSFTPEGCYYYQEHKVEIKKIVEKYLQPQEDEENSAYNTVSDLFE